MKIKKNGKIIQLWLVIELIADVERAGGKLTIVNPVTQEKYQIKKIGSIN